VRLHDAQIIADRLSRRRRLPRRPPPSGRAPRARSRDRRLVGSPRRRQCWLR